MRYVALSTDLVAPTYAVLAPITAWIWSILGYRPIVTVSEEGKDTPLGQAVLDELDAAGAIVMTVPCAEPLDIANTMRTARVVTAACAGLKDDDVVLMADVDMLPLSRTFFDRHEDFFVLRALYHGWSHRTPPDISLVLSAKYRIAMCYAAAAVRRWRSMLPIVVGDPAGSLRALLDAELACVPEGARSEEWSRTRDEIWLTSAFLSQVPRGSQIEVVEAGLRWRLGPLTLIDPTTAPKISPNYDIPRGMVLWYDCLSIPEGAIDCIPSRFDAPGSWVWFDVAGAHFPELSPWREGYRDRMQKIIGF